MPMTQYPYPTSGATDTRIYRPQQPPRYANMDPDDSTAPLNYSDSTSRYPPDTSSPQVITSASSFDEDPSAAKVRQPKKGKKKGGSGVASEKEKEAMMSVGYSSAAGSSKSCSVTYLLGYFTLLSFTKVKRLNNIALRVHSSELRHLICHMGSHSVTC